MNKRLERVNSAKEWLKIVDNKIHDARFGKDDMALFLDNGYIFYVQGFTTKEFYEKFVEAKDGNNSLQMQREGTVSSNEGRESE